MGQLPNPDSEVRSCPWLNTTKNKIKSPILPFYVDKLSGNEQHGKANFYKDKKVSYFGPQT